MTVCNPAAVATRPAPRGRRYDFPPLWLVPIVLIVAIIVIVLVSSTLGLLGLVAGLFAIYWLQRKTDEYVRGRDTFDDG